MPDVFALNTFVRMSGLPRASAKVLLSRWVGRGYLQPTGQRTGIYLNRVRDPHGERASTVRALAMAYPSATLIGASVLHAHGWTTQLPRELHVAVEPRRSYVQIDGVVLHPRPVRWFRAIHQAQGFFSDREGHQGATATSDAATTYGLRSLHPAWALADAFADNSGRSWQPDEDDLDIPDEDLDALVGALDAMGVPEEHWPEVARPQSAPSESPRG